MRKEMMFGLRSLSAVNLQHKATVRSKASTKWFLPRTSTHKNKVQPAGINGKRRQNLEQNYARTLTQDK